MFRYGRMSRRPTGIKGPGTYGVTYNRLMDPNRTLKGSRRGVMVTHSEMIGNLQSSVSFASTDFIIQPGVAATFPWLQTFAPLFEQWKPVKIAMEFKSNSGDAISGTNTALGRVIACTEYNIQSPTFTTSLQMYNHENCKSSKPSLSFMHHINCRPSTMPVDPLYTRVPTSNNNTQVNNDPRFSDLARFTVATEGMQEAGHIIGQVWIHYTIIFYKKQLPLSDVFAYTDLYSMRPWASGSALNAIHVGDLPGLGGTYGYGYGNQNVPFGNGTHSSVDGSLRLGSGNMIPAPFNQAGTWLTTNGDGNSVGTSASRLVFYPSSDITVYQCTLRICMASFSGSTPFGLTTNNILISGLNVVVGALVSANNLWYSGDGTGTTFNVQPLVGNSAFGGSEVAPAYSSSFSSFTFNFTITVAGFSGTSYADSVRQGAYIDMSIQTGSAQLTFGRGTQLLVSVLTDNVQSNPALLKGERKLSPGLRSHPTKPQSVIPPLRKRVEVKASILDHDSDPEDGQYVLDDGSDDDVGLIGIEEKDHPFPDDDAKTERPLPLPAAAATPLSPAPLRRSDAVAGIKRSKENDNLQQFKVRRTASASQKPPG